MQLRLDRMTQGVAWVLRRAQGAEYPSYSDVFEIATANCKSCPPDLSVLLTSTSLLALHRRLLALSSALLDIQRCPLSL
eukprot:3439741-Pleurochrysis_carterae.AAC.2